MKLPQCSFIIDDVERVEIMAQITFEEVVKLAKQLSPAEQQALITYLQRLAQQGTLGDEEWKTLLDSSKVSIPPGPNFSDRRADWYDNDGR
jgi:hypothetical protein